MTLDTLSRFGVTVEKAADGYFIPGGQTYRPVAAYAAEGDWSNAAFWLCAGALGGDICVRGLDRAWTKPPPEYPVLQIDRAVVRARIAARLDDMFLAGLEREKAELHHLYPVWSRTASLAIGYRDGDDREKIYVRTCQLAKRQDTWFRHQATAIYIPVGATAEETAGRVRAVWRARGPWPVAL